MNRLLTIEQVCEVARMSKPTIYRKVKAKTFPSPTKVPTNAGRGPKLVNRWYEKQILDHMLALNLKKAQSAQKAVTNPPIEDTDKHWHENIPPINKAWFKKNEHSILAVIGGLLAGLAVWFFK